MPRGIASFGFFRTAFATVLGLAGCAESPEPDVDVLVIGAGIAGLSAALEAGRGGARVLVVEANSVAGGHAVQAGGFALVGTPLQESKGIADTPELAFDDLMRWGEVNDPDWTRAYVEDSRAEVHDFLADLGVAFRVLIPAPEHSVPRFHFTEGKAVHAVLPLLRAVLDHPSIGLSLNSAAIDLVKEAGAVRGAVLEHTRTGERQTVRARSVIVATGGFQANLERVMAHWPADMPRPDRLLVGSGYFASGAGIWLADEAGAATRHLDRQVTFVGGLPDPREMESGRALQTSNEAAVWVNAAGARFVNEAAPDKITVSAVLDQDPATYWLVFDSAGLKSLRVRDANWLTPETIAAEIVGNDGLVVRADRIADLADAAGLPAAALVRTVAAYNLAVVQGEDSAFGRFDAQSRRKPQPIAAPPFYAVQLYPMTRKNMGGVAIDRSGRAVNADGDRVPGLYAAGESTGVAGINGSVGMSGTFLGPSVYTGRIAARSALADLAVADMGAAVAKPMVAWEGPPPAPAPEAPGFWHYTKVHAFAAERGDGCTACHDTSFPMATPAAPATLLARTGVCTRCH